VNVRQFLAAKRPGGFNPTWPARNTPHKHTQTQRNWGKAVNSRLQTWAAVGLLILASFLVGAAIGFEVVMTR